MKKFLSLLALASLIASPALATLDGSSITLLSPASANPGDTVQFCFVVTNGSPDGEYVREVRFTLPEDSDVLSGWYDDTGLGWDFGFSIYGAYNNYASFLDADGDPGEIAPGETGYFYLTIHLFPNMDCGPQEIDAKLYGDETGDHPHWIRFFEHIDLCAVPTQSNSWSSLKNLYR